MSLLESAFPERHQVPSMSGKIVALNLVLGANLIAVVYVLPWRSAAWLRWMESLSLLGRCRRGAGGESLHYLVWECIFHRITAL